MQKHVNLVDLVKTQELSNVYLLFTKYLQNRLQYSQERASQIVEVIHFIFQFTP